MALVLISAGFELANSALSPSRATVRPSPVIKSATTALINGLELGSAAACASSALPANDSFKRPHSPLGSAAVIAIPAFTGLLSSSDHSSLVKFVLSAMDVL